MNRGINESNNLQQEDITLVKSFQAGDKLAFDKLVLKYKNKVFYLCLRFLGDYTEADDLAQEVFVKVYRSLNKFQFKSSFSTWLYRISANTCKNKFKSLEYRYRKKMVRLDSPNKDDEDAPSFEIGDESMSPVNRLERKEKEAQIQEAIDSLPERQKMVTVLRDVEGLSYEEIVKITDFNLGTVKSTIARARQSLRKKLKGVL